MARLTSPTGVTVTTSAEVAAELLRRGFTSAEAEQPKKAAKKATSKTSEK